MVRLSSLTLSAACRGLALGAFWFYAGITVGAEEAQNSQINIKIVAFNDFHGALNATGMLSLPDPARASRKSSVPIGGAAHLQHAIRRLAAANPLTVVVGAGDMIGASPLVSAYFRDEPAIEVLNLIGLEVSALGNHELDRGIEELLRLQSGDGRFAGARFKYLAANVVSEHDAGPVLPGSWVKEFAAGQAGKLRVGFIGVVTRNTPSLVVKDRIAELRFTDEAVAANKLAAELSASGVQAIVLLIHEGIETDGDFKDKTCPNPRGDLMPILRALDGRIDLVISGHTHQAYICSTTLPGSDKPILYTSAGSYGRFVTDIDVTIERSTGDVVHSSADNVPVIATGDASDSAVQAVVNTYSQRVAAIEGQVVGRITADITNQDGKLGSLIADAQREATAPAARGGAIAAFVNRGGIRANLMYARSAASEAPGDITYGEAFAVQPMGNRLVTMTLTGAQLNRLIAQSRSREGAPALYDSPGFTDIPLIDDARYRITVNDFLASGGDGFTVLTEGIDRQLGPTDIDALVEYLQRHNPLGD